MIILDATAPLVLDAKPLRRRAGAMVRVDRTFPAPAGWAISTAEVPPGSPGALQVRLEGVVEGVLVSGTATVTFDAECSRCLAEVHQDLVVDVQQLFEYHDLQQALPHEALDEEPLPTLQGDLLDLEPVVRDGVVLDLPLAPLCSDDCPGLCPTCGARLADDPGHQHQEQDGRWAELQTWLESQGSASEAGPDRNDTKGN